MIFWLVLKLEISYRAFIISRRILVSFRGFFWRLYFCMVKYLSFHIYIYIYIFPSRHNLMQKWQGHKSVTHPLFVATGEIIWFTWSKPLKWCTHPLYIVLSSFLIGPCCRLSMFILAPTSIVYYVLSFQFAYSYFVFLLNEHTIISILLCCPFLFKLLIPVLHSFWMEHTTISIFIMLSPIASCCHTCLDTSQ
jgi:hypothetical protein